MIGTMTIVTETNSVSDPSLSYDGERFATASQSQSKLALCESFTQGLSNVMGLPHSDRFIEILLQFRDGHMQWQISIS